MLNIYLKIENKNNNFNAIINKQYFKFILILFTFFNKFYYTVQQVYIGQGLKTRNLFFLFFIIFNMKIFTIYYIIN